MKIKKKAWPELFEAVLAGRKNFDLRLNDFKVKERDILVLEEWNPAKKEYTGRKIEKKVRFVLKSKDLNFWNKEEIERKGFQVIGF